jgi:hypothetical protein
MPFLVQLASFSALALRTGGDWIGKFPSMAFGLGYVLSIPLFALFYMLTPWDFYNATAKYEPLVLAQSDAVASRLRRTFLEKVEPDNPRRPLLSGIPVRKSQDDVFPSFRIEPEPDRVRILVNVLANDVPGFTDPFVKVALDMDESAAMEFIALQTQQEATGWNDVKTVMVSVNMHAQLLSGDDTRLPQLFPCKQGDDRTCLKMTLDDYSFLLSLKATAAGHPTKAQNSYLRMLYFSAVTMSTLGYGDIVPITTRSRALVTIQVILGPVLFGLFLNSLAKERQRNK